MEGGTSAFMPIHETSLQYMKMYKKKFLCVNKNDLEIYGSYDSKKGKRLQVYLNKCLGKDYCRSDEEIQQFFRYKFLLLLKNQIRFDSEKIGSESITLESRADWNRVTN